MAKSKTTWMVITGAVSAILGSAGAVITSFGLCACILAPAFSLLGITAIVMSFLSKNGTYFLAIGVAFLAGSFILYEKKQTCDVHKK